VTFERKGGSREGNKSSFQDVQKSGLGVKNGGKGQGGNKEARSGRTFALSLGKAKGSSEGKNLVASLLVRRSLQELWKRPFRKGPKLHHKEQAGRLEGITSKSYRVIGGGGGVKGLQEGKKKR